MLGTINPEILFLQQEDQIKAGLLDMKMILEIVMTKHMSQTIIF